MKTFLRTNAIYKSESKQLDDDIDITDLFSEKNIIATLKEETALEESVKKITEELADLTELVLMMNKEIVSNRKTVKPTTKKK